MTPITNLNIIEYNLKKFSDERGTFYESFSKELDNLLNVNFKQDIVSMSKKGTIRGLHYQWDKPMGKLIHVIKGKIIDYVLNITQGSENYGQYYKYELSEQNNKCIWVPPGYAHGFEAIEDTIVSYKCGAFYNPLADGAIYFFDNEINIKSHYSLADSIMSEKDINADSFQKYRNNPKFVWEK